MTETKLFTSESVTEGHPDKIADQISDSVLDRILQDDPNARVAAETLLAKGLVVVAGEIATETYVNVEEVVRDTILEIGYDNAKYGLDGNSVGVLNAIIPQSPEIAAGVFNSIEAREKFASDRYDQQGAGDQGIIFGYANGDNTSYHPAAHKLAHLLSARLTSERKTGEGRGLLLPDGKTQVTLRYVDGVPVAVDTVLISTQHTHEIRRYELQELVKESVIRPVIEDYNQNHNLLAPLEDSGNYIINPAGEWHVGASAADTGLTGRKIVVDTATAPHLGALVGGGAFSGKDPSKVDRSAAYYARYAAKNLVASGAAKEALVQVSYAIGQATPVSYSVNTNGTGVVSDEKLVELLSSVFDFRPLAIIENLDLRTPRYRVTAKNGHFGRNPDGLFTWEAIDKVTEIRSAL